MLDKRFQIASGSIVGRDHVGSDKLLKGKNNQDAWFCLQTPTVIVAIVADGCGSGEHSEVGAQLGVRLLAHQLVANIRRFPRCMVDTYKWQHYVLKPALGFVIGRMKKLACDLGADEVHEDFFLYTLVGAVVTPYQTRVFTLGDGYYAINNEITRVGPFADNAPPYLGYSISRATEAGGLVQVKNPILMPTSEIDSLLLGTDGLEDLIASVDKPIPAKDALVGPWWQFCTEDAYFANSDAINRKLRLINSSPVCLVDGTLQRHNGLLRDDTTLVVIRRNPNWEATT